MHDLSEMHADLNRKPVNDLPDSFYGIPDSVTFRNIISEIDYMVTTGKAPHDAEVAICMEAFRTHGKLEKEKIQLVMKYYRKHGIEGLYWGKNKRKGKTNGKAGRNEDSPETGN